MARNRMDPQEYEEGDGRQRGNDGPGRQLRLATSQINTINRAEMGTFVMQ
jgi:hypothetical protein